jgi:hypothetical protein
MGMDHPKRGPIASDPEVLASVYKWLGEWRQPTEVARLVKETYGIVVSDVAVRKYLYNEPHASKVWEIRTKTDRVIRNRFPYSNRAVRIQQLHHDLDDIETMIADSVQRMKIRWAIMDRIREEMGDGKKTIFAGTYQDNRQVNLTGGMPPEVAEALMDQMRQEHGQVKRPDALPAPQAQPIEEVILDADVKEMVAVPKKAGDGE